MQEFQELRSIKILFSQEFIIFISLIYILNKINVEGEILPSHKSLCLYYRQHLTSENDVIKICEESYIKIWPGYPHLPG
jgi:hypothetical protein